MIDEIIDLRNRIHNDDFRFSITPEHWKALYVPENTEKSHLATVKEEGKLRGYAAFYVVNFEDVKAYDVREIVAEDEDTLTRLLDQIKDKGLKDDVDFIFLKRCEEPYTSVLDKKGFSPFVESVIMIALLDPLKLLSTLSQKVESGEVLRLLVKGFGQIDIKVGETGIMLVHEEKPDLALTTDSRAFLRIFFGKTSLLNQLLRRRVKLEGIRNFSTAQRFFRIIKQPKWYIPMGDWV